MYKHITGDKMGKQFEFFMSEKDEQKLKEYLQQLNVKILFEGKSHTSIEITNLPPCFFRHRMVSIISLQGRMG